MSITIDGTPARFLLSQACGNGLKSCLPIAVGFGVAYLVNTLAREKISSFVLGTAAGIYSACLLEVYSFTLTEAAFLWLGAAGAAAILPGLQFTSFIVSLGASAGLGGRAVLISVAVMGAFAGAAVN